MGLFKTFLPIAFGAALGFATFGAGFAAIPGIAASFTVAGVGISSTAGLLGAAIGSQVLGGLFGAARAPPISDAAEQTLANVADPEYPRTAVYGERMVGWSWVFQESTVPTGPDDGAWLMLTVCVADHPCEELVGIQINDDYLDITADMEEVTTGYTFPSSYWNLPLNDGIFVPKDGNKYKTVYQGERDGPEVWHVAIKPFLGAQTASDTWFNGLSSDYSAFNRVGRGLTYVNLVLVVNPELTFGGQVPQLRFRVRGKNDIRTTTGVDAYTENPVYIARDYAKWRLDLTNANFDQTNLDAQAAIADADLPGHAGVAKYRYGEAIPWSDPPLGVFEDILKHAAAVWHERGDKIIIQAGAARSPVMTLTEADFVDGVPPSFDTVLEPEQQANSVVGHVIQRADSEGTQVWEPRPLNPVTDAAWVAADAGQEIRLDVDFNGCTNFKRGKYLATIIANRLRLQAQLTGAFGMKARALEKGDVVTFTYAARGISLDMEVRDTRQNFMDSHVGLMLREWDDAAFSGTVIEDEDLGKFPKKYSADIPAVTGLTASTVPDSSLINARGEMWAKVLLEWTAVNRVWVQAGGSYRIRYRRSGFTDWRGTTVDGHTLGVELLMQRGNHEMQVRARDAFGNRGPWSTTLTHSVTPEDDDLPAPPAENSTIDNLISNPRFDQKELAWDPIDDFHTGTGSITWITPTGIGTPEPFSPWAVRLVSGGSGTESPAGSFDIRLTSLQAPHVEQGGFYVVKAWHRPVSDGQLDRVELVLLGEDLSFVQTLPAATGESVGDPLRAIKGIVQIPHLSGVSRARIQFINKASDSDPTNGHTTDVWALKMREAETIRGRERKDTADISGSTWQTVVGLDGNEYEPPALGRAYKAIFRGVYRVKTAPTTSTATLSIRITRRVEGQVGGGAPGTDELVIAPALDIRTIPTTDPESLTRETWGRLVGFDEPPLVDVGSPGPQAQKYIYRGEAHITGDDSAVVDFFNCSMILRVVDDEDATT